MLFKCFQFMILVAVFISRSKEIPDLCCWLLPSLLCSPGSCYWVSSVNGSKTRLSMASIHDLSYSENDYNSGSHLCPSQHTEYEERISLVFSPSRIFHPHEIIHFHSFELEILLQFFWSSFPTPAPKQYYTMVVVAAEATQARQPSKMLIEMTLLSD